MNKAHKRSCPRIDVKVWVQCTLGGKSVRCRALNMGGGGLFLTEAPGLEPGAEVSLRFRPAKHLPVMQAKGRVCYTVPGHGAAVEFAEINPDDHHALLHFIHGRTGDRRFAPGPPLATQVEFKHASELAFSRDVSLGGMFIEIREPPPVGTQVFVRFNLGYVDKVIATPAQVAYHVKKMGMGVFFTNLSLEDSEAISDYVARTALPASSPTQEGKSVA